MNTAGDGGLCPWCGAAAPDDDQAACPECGRALGGAAARWRRLVAVLRRRRRWLLYAGGALLVAGVGVGLFFLARAGGDEEVAQVGDTTFYVSDIAALFEGDTLALDEVFRESLFRVMAVEALEQALVAEFQATVDPAEVQYYMDRYDALLGAGQTPAQVLNVPGASLEMVQHNARLQAVRDLAINELMLAPETVESYFADPMTLTTVCTKHIRLETEEEAEAVLDRLEAGEDFAAVAAEVSLDTGLEGGDLGCARIVTYVPEFAQAAMEAPLGEVVGPVQTEFGFHVLVVSERTTPTREEYLANPGAVLNSDEVSDLWSQWLNGVLQAADASVAPRFGCWVTIGIKAPEDCEATTTTSE